MATLELRSYRRKGVNAYLWPLGGGESDYDFGTPATEEDEQRAYKSKSHIVKIDLSTKPDGGYKSVEAWETRRRSNYLLIKEGEIIEQYDSEAELLKALNPMKLPELWGSDKQVAWAESIRSKFIAEIGDRITDWSPQSAAYEALYRHSNAKIWIDNRDKLKPEKFIQKVQELEAEWAAEGEAQKLADAIASEEANQRITAHDELLSEAEIYAVVYPDCIEVKSYVTGAGELIPKKNRKYVGGKGDMRWQYPLSELEAIKGCRSIDFILDSEGNQVD